jgi:hypothetical protein
VTAQGRRDEEQDAGHVRVGSGPWRLVGWHRGMPWRAWDGSKMGERQRAASIGASSAPTGAC